MGKQTHATRPHARNTPTATAIATLACLLGGGAAAQTPRIGVLEDEVVIGVGGIEAIEAVLVGDSGRVVTKVDTNGGTSQQNDGAVLFDGTPALLEGMPLVSPAGRAIDDWLFLELTPRGDLLAAIQITPGSAWGAMRNFDTLVASGDPAVSSFLPDTATWENIDFVRGGPDRVYVMGRIDNPDLVRNRSQTLLRVDLAPDGSVLGREVLATEAMPVEALGIVVRALGGNPNSALPASAFDTNAQGDFFTLISGQSERMLTINYETIVDQAGAVSPVGRVWQSFDDTRVSINDHGETLYTGVIRRLDDADPTTWVMALNGEKFVQSGDVLPGVSDAPITAPPDRSETPVFLTNAGDVFWIAHFDGGQALVRNREAILTSSVTVVEGMTIGGFPDDAQSFGVSPDGRFLAARTVLGGLDVVLVVDFGLVAEIPGCFGNEGRLTTVAGRAAVGESLTFAMDEGQAPGDVARIAFSTRARIPGSGCGVVGPFGESLTSRAHRVGTLFVPPWDGTNPTTQTAAIPKQLALVDSVFFAQGWFRTPDTGAVRLTNGLRIEIGAP